MNPNGYGKNIGITENQKIDRKKFEEIIDKYYNETYLFARNLTRNEDLAKDLVQDVFFKFWKKRKNFKKNATIKGWLFTSVRNVYIDNLRKYKKEVYLVETMYVEVVEEIAQDKQGSLDRKIKILEKGIEELPKKCHTVFTLSKREGLTNDEIAKYLSISVKTVEGHLTGAIKTLRNKLRSVEFPILFTSVSSSLTEMYDIFFCI